MSYKLTLQEVCRECKGEGKIPKIDEFGSDYFGSTRFPSQVTCYTCKGTGYTYEESHTIPELKERIILNFSEES